MGMAPTQAMDLMLFELGTSKEKLQTRGRRMKSSRSP